MAWRIVLGGTLNTNDAANLPVIATSSGNLVFTFKRVQAPLNGTTSVVIEVGNALTTWPHVFLVPASAQTNNPGVTVLKDSPAVGSDTVTLRLPLTADAKRFVRLKVVP